jgi:hypothetical protein
MRLKHNKKRNTAVLFEALVKELTKAVVAKDSDRREVVLHIIKEAFKRGSALKRELTVYDSVLKTEGVSPRQAEKILKEATRQYAALSKEDIFAEQTALIDKINKLVSPEAFDNFVPSYTAMATAYQLFNRDLSPKSRVILEEQVLLSMTHKVISETKKTTKVSHDKLVMKTHIKKFNEAFGTALLKEQKTLLQKYINSFSDNGLDLKIFLNEEIGRLRTIISESADTNKEFVPVVETIDSFKGQWITNDLLKKVLKLQELAGELQNSVS